jgi:flagellar basal-body rod protein FlgF
MDKALFLGTHSAKNAMRQLEIITNNLANVSTTGFRADYESVKQFSSNKKEDQTRVYSMLDKTYSDFKMGPVIHTDRPLDVSIAGDGFIAVQTKLGKEGYTRAGDLQIKDGFLKTQAGDLVLGSGGPIRIGPVDQISVGEDGTISARMTSNDRNLVALNRIKLVKPPLAQLQKGTDGMFYMVGDQTAKQNDQVKIVPGTLEGSNVNPVQTLTSLIELSRQFELHTNMMKTMQDESSKANQILALSR